MKVTAIDTVPDSDHSFDSMNSQTESEPDQILNKIKEFRGKIQQLFNCLLLFAKFLI